MTTQGAPVAWQDALPARYFEMASAYPVVFEQAPHNWAAYVPDLPGCVAAADSREETEQLIHEAIALHLESMEEDGDPWPTPGTTHPPLGT